MAREVSALPMFVCVCVCVCRWWAIVSMYLQACSAFIDCWGCICIHSGLLGLELDAQLLFCSWLNFCFKFVGLVCVCVCVYEKNCESNRLLLGGSFTVAHCVPHLSSKPTSPIKNLRYTFWGHRWWKFKDFQTNWQIELWKTDREGERG